MMQGYDKDAAVEFITRCIRKADHPELAEDIPALVPQMIDADMAYMHEAGVLDDDGYAGDAYYEDDEAIEYIVESLAAKNALDPEQAVKLAALVDDYLDAQQMFWNRRVWWSTRNKQNHNMRNGSAPRWLARADPLFCTLFSAFNVISCCLLINSYWIVFLSKLNCFFTKPTSIR